MGNKTFGDNEEDLHELKTIFYEFIPQFLHRIAHEDCDKELHGRAFDYFVWLTFTYCPKGSKTDDGADIERSFGGVVQLLGKLTTEDENGVTVTQRILLFVLLFPTLVDSFGRQRR
jgi:hypothetical protein